nr:MAG TPA: DVL family [Caudoviricetes sp.]
MSRFYIIRRKVKLFFIQYYKRNFFMPYNYYIILLN